MSNELYRVRQMFDDGSTTYMEGLSHQDLCALVETFDNLPSMLICVIFPEDAVTSSHPVGTMQDLDRDALRLMGNEDPQAVIDSIVHENGN